MQEKSRIDTVLKFILQNTDSLSPEKITALATVITSLKGGPELKEEPNTIPEDANQDEFSEDQPFDISEIDSLEIDGKKVTLR